MLARDFLAQPIRARDFLAADFKFGGGKSRGAGGGGSLLAPPTPEEEAIQSVAHPLEPIMWVPGLRATGPMASSIIGGSGAASAGVLQDVAERRNPLPNLPGNLVAGAALGPVFGAAGNLIRRSGKALFKPRIAGRPTPALPASAPPEPVAPAPTAPAQQAIAAAPRTPLSPEPAPSQASPFTGQSAQQQTAGTTEMISEIQKSPAYLRRLRNLGGGRVQTNRQTLDEAIKQGAMSPEEISAWPAERPINTVIQTRALLTKDMLGHAWERAVESGDAQGANAARETLNQIEPGIVNLRATGGRATQAQAMFVRDQVNVELEKLADMQAKGIPFEQMRVAVREMRKRLTRDKEIIRTQGRFLEWIKALETYATAAKLTSPVTHAVNSVSNILTFTVARPVQKTLTAGFQLAQGNPEGALASMQALYGTSVGFQNGLRRWGHTMMDDALDVGKTEVSRGLPLRGKARFFDPFRHLSAADAFAKGVLEDSELHQMAFASARKQGLHGLPMAERITELTNNPPSAWLERAQKTGREFTFQEHPDNIIKPVLAIANFPGMRLVVPFMLTPYNLAKFQFQRSALAPLSPRNVRGVLAGGDKQAEALARVTMGIGFTIGALALVKSNDVSGAYPKDKATRDLWQAEGRTEYSIRVGGRRLSYGRFQPFGTYLGQAVALNDALEARDKKSIGEIVPRMIASGGKQMLDQPFVSGMSSLLDAVNDPERSATRFVSQTATGLVPNILRDVRYQTDSKQRAAKGIVAPVMNMLPGVSSLLPEKVDALGRTIEHDPNRMARASKVLSQTRESPQTETMRMVRDVADEEESGPKNLSPADQARLDRELGKAKARGIDIATSQPGYDSLTPSNKAKAVVKSVNHQRDVVRARWKYQNSH